MIICGLIPYDRVQVTDATDIHFDGWGLRRRYDLDDLGKQRAQVAEWVFRALTAGSTIADAVRRPTRLDELIVACGGDEAGVRAVVDAFRAPGVNFLVPELDPHNPKLAPDT